MAAQTNLSIAQKQRAVSSAATAYGVPEAILWGVYGLETDFGQNVSTSSAGAVGAFQFLPSTAAGFNYPLTNTPSYPQFWDQTQSAAKYLQQLFQQTGSWDSALKHYSGGGYGLTQVDAKATSAESRNLSGKGFYPGLLASIVGGYALAGAGLIGDVGAAGAAAADTAGADVAGATGGASGGAAGYASKGLGDLATLAKTGGIAALLVDPHFLLRAVEIVGGMVLLYFGLRQLAMVGTGRA